MPRESDLWADLRGVLPRDGHWARVENPCDPGTPDVSFCWRAIEGWIELKFHSRRPRPATTVLGDEHGVRPSQKIWIRERLRAGGRVLIGVGIAREFYLIHGRYFDEVNGWCYADFRSHSLSIANRFDAAEVLEGLATALRYSPR